MFPTRMLSKLFDVIAPLKYAETGGYTRILELGTERETQQR